MVERADVFDDLDRFDQKLKMANHLGQDDSSEEEEQYKGASKTPLSEADVMREKNKILMEKLFKS